MSESLSDNVITKPPQPIRCEIAVVGSGPGGSITACMLAEAGRDVLLIEEGPYLPLESCEPFSLEEMVQKYRNGGITIAMGSPKVQYVEGQCVGGGSESIVVSITVPQLKSWKSGAQNLR
jgi:choline dehydrogenase-like flavoprotein